MFVSVLVKLLAVINQVVLDSLAWGLGFKKLCYEAPRANALNPKPRALITATSSRHTKKINNWTPDIPGPYAAFGFL